jgi:hypothetical protein
MECGGPEPPSAKSGEMLRCAVGLCQGMLARASERVELLQVWSQCA